MKIIKTNVIALISILLIFSPVAYADKWSDQFPHIKATGDIPGECSYESISKKNYKGKKLKINTIIPGIQTDNSIGNFSVLPRAKEK